MKIVLVTQDAPLYIGPFLSCLFTRLAAGAYEVLGVVALSPTFNKTIIQEIRSRLAYYGWGDFVRMALLIVWNQLLSQLSRLQPSLGCFSLRNALRQHGIARLAVRSVNSPDFINYIQREQVDVVLSVASSQIFKSVLLNAPQKACVNYHQGLLPRYRGRQPLFWAMLYDEPQIGLSVHEMDAELDNGPILAQTTVPVEPGDTLHSLYLKTIAIGPELIVTALDRLAAGSRERLPNDAIQASYFSFPTKDDAQLFRARKKRFF